MVSHPVVGFVKQRFWTTPACELRVRNSRRLKYLAAWFFATMPEAGFGNKHEMRTTDFDQIVERAFLNIPARFRSRMNNVAVVVEDEPALIQITARGVSRGSTLLGLYEGRPLTHRSVFESFHLPDQITIFQGPHERLARNRDDLERLVEQTLWHEIAHHFGMNEREVRAAERLRRMRRLWPH
jgi:predicted Zn-dependent protease with MMP-like domain